MISISVTTKVVNLTHKVIGDGQKVNPGDIVSDEILFYLLPKLPYKPYYDLQFHPLYKQTYQEFKIFTFVLTTVGSEAFGEYNIILSCH